MTPEEKLRRMLKDYEPKIGAAGEHLRDEDFVRLLENEPDVEMNGASSTAGDELAAPRRHLAGCDSCIKQFRDFYHFFAPAEDGEAVAEKSEIDAAWKAFSARVVDNKSSEKITNEKITNEKKSSLWARLFAGENKRNRFSAFGWAFAALLFLFTGLAWFVAWQAKNENSQLSAQLERQKQSSEERLKTLEQAAQNRDTAEQEKTELQAEKDELEKQIARLQTEIERSKQQSAPTRENISPPVSPNSPAEKPDNSLVAVNTPIYDVFPGDAVVRGGTRSANKLIVPNTAKNIVLILNAAGRADFPVYQAVLVNGAGKIVWRGGGLRKDSTGNFTLTIALAALKTGNYQLKLSSGAQPVAEYPIAIEIGK